MKANGATAAPAPDALVQIDSTAGATLDRCQVLVGVDESSLSMDAVVQAAWEADMRGWPLRIVKVGGERFGASKSGFLSSAVTRARSAMPLLRVDADEMPGRSDALIDLSGQMGLLVAGDRDEWQLRDLFAGPWQDHVVTRARCPVLICRASDGATAGQRLGHPLIVGIDGSTGSYAAFVFAVEEARLRGVGVIVAHAARFNYPKRDPLTSNILADVGDACLGVPIHRRRISKDPRDALRDMSVHAGALVVGAREIAGQPGRLVPHVTHTLIRDAFCPVFVIHGTEEVPVP